MKLIDNWLRCWWTMASTWLAMIAGLVGGWLAAHPDEAQEIIEFLRGYFGPFAPLIVGVAITSVAGASRMVEFKQTKEKNP